MTMKLKLKLNLYQKRQRLNLIQRLRRVLNRQVWTSGKEQRQEILTAMLGFANDWHSVKHRSDGYVACGGFAIAVTSNKYPSHRYWLTEDGNIIDRHNGDKEVFTKGYDQ